MDLSLSGVTQVNETSHTCLLHRCIEPWAMPVFMPQPKNVKCILAGTHFPLHWGLMAESAFRWSPIPVLTDPTYVTVLMSPAPLPLHWLTGMWFCFFEAYPVFVSYFLLPFYFLVPWGTRTNRFVRVLYDTVCGYRCSACVVSQLPRWVWR